MFSIPYLVTILKDHIDLFLRTRVQTMKPFSLPQGLVAVFVCLLMAEHSLQAQIATNVPRDTPTPISILKYAAKPTYESNSEWEKNRFPRLAGEFEEQKAVVLSVSDLMYQHFGVLVEIVEKTSGRVPLVILVNDDKQLGSTYNLLNRLTCDLSHVQLKELKLDTIWLRDFGPRIAETDSRAVSMDFFYDGQRPLDDKFPVSWATIADAEPQRVEWTLHGGNLLSNGQGLAIATSRIFEDNFIQFPRPMPGMDIEFERRKIVVDGFKKDCNINQLVVLDPLRPEATRHVDMFAAFLNPDRILIASVDPRQDPYNARVLDNNAALMRQVTVNGKPMRVERIAVPPREDKYWSPYTNIILANELVLMPVYDSDPPTMIRSAIEKYKQLLPGFTVETIDMTSMRKLEGALHCMSVNIPAFASLPEGMLSMEQAKTRLARLGHDFNAPIEGSQYASAPPASPTSNVGRRNVASNSNPRVNAGSNSNASRTNETATKATATADSQRAAAMTYRRKFVDGSGSFTIDAFAIGLREDSVLLLRANSRQTVAVPIQRLSADDQDWIARNVEKIRTNGDKVRAFVIGGGA